MPTLARRSFLALCAAAGLGATACAADGSSGPAVGAGPIDAGDGATRERIAFADHEHAFADLWLPAGDGAVPVVVLVHGGFWRQQYELDLMDGLAASLVDAGYAAWNIEYRRVGGGGGFPETFDDVAAAVDHLAVLDRDRLDLERVAVAGHSAGGHLAAWVASRHVLPAGVPGADPLVRPIVAFPQAGVLDLVACAEDGVGGRACPDLLGAGPDEVPEIYTVASPLALVPIGVPVIAVHGSRDDVVPPAQSERYVRTAAAAGDPAELVIVAGADHFDVIDPGHESWQAILDRLPDHLG